MKELPSVKGEKDMHEVTLGCVLLSLSTLLSSPPRQPPLPVKTCGIRRYTHPGNELTREKEMKKQNMGRASDGGKGEEIRSNRLFEGFWEMKR